MYIYLLCMLCTRYEWIPTLTLPASVSTKGVSVSVRVGNSSVEPTPGITSVSGLWYGTLRRGGVEPPLCEWLSNQMRSNVLRVFVRTFI